MAENWLIEMLETPAKPSPIHGICACGHEGIAGNVECFRCLNNSLQEEFHTRKAHRPGQFGVEGVCNVIPSTQAT